MPRAADSSESSAYCIVRTICFKSGMLGGMASPIQNNPSHSTRDKDSDGPR